MQRKDYTEELNAALCAEPEKLDNLEPPPSKEQGGNKKVNKTIDLWPSDMEASLKRNLVGYNNRKKVRCERCGRVIENSFGSTALAIHDKDAFFEYYGDVPVRTTALLCHSCNGYLESCTDTQAHKRAMLEAFCEFPKDVEKTVRGEFEEKDLLWIFERMQFVLRGYAKGEHLTHDNCVRDIFTDGGYKCPIGTDKANAASCNKCLLNWLREERHK